MMRGFVLHRYELSPTRFDRFRVFCPISFLKTFKPVKTNVKQMQHFPTFSQSPSPQAPWHPSQKMRLEISCNLGPVSSRLDQMAPHSCPFFVSNFDVFHKPLFPTSFALLDITMGQMGNTIYLCFSLVSHLYPIFPMVPFHDIVWEQGQKASRHMGPSRLYGDLSRTWV